MDTDEFEEEDAAYEERCRLRREAEMQKWAAREGLVRLSDRPQQQAKRAFRRSLPSFADAQRLFALLREGLGERAELDPWAAANEECLVVRDADHPGWFLPQRLAWLLHDPEPAASMPMPMHFEMPERIKRIVARKQKREAEEKARQEAERAATGEKEAEVVTLAPRGRPGKLGIHEGPANVTVTYGERGEFGEWVLTAGDTFAFSRGDVEPFTLDPYARPPMAPPLSFLLDPGLVEGGVTVSTLARMVLAMPFDQADRGRVYPAVLQPGNVTGAWFRGLHNLRRAEWRGDTPAEAAWVVVDAWNGTAIASGGTLAEAFAAWKEVVSKVQPLPPVEGKTATEPEEPETTPPVPDASKLPENTAVVSTGSIRIEIHPPVYLEWPAPRPENVPAIAVPLPALPAVPADLVSHGFSRAIRYIGEHGEVGFGFVRERGDGLLLVGDEALPAVDIDTLDAEMDRVDAESSAGWLDLLGHGNPYTHPRYPVQSIHYCVWDNLGRTPEFREGGAAWGPELGQQGWTPTMRHTVTRVSYVQLSGARPDGGGAE